MIALAAVGEVAAFGSDTAPVARFPFPPRRRGGVGGRVIDTIETVSAVVGAGGGGAGAAFVGDCTVVAPSVAGCSIACNGILSSNVTPTLAEVSGVTFVEGVDGQPRELPAPSPSGSPSHEAVGTKSVAATLCGSSKVHGGRAGGVAEVRWVVIGRLVSELFVPPGGRGGRWAPAPA